MNSRKFLVIGTVVVHLAGFSSVNATEQWGNGQSDYSKSKIKLATYCNGEPNKIEWVTAQSINWKEGPFCYLPLKQNHLGDPPHMTQWIDHGYGTREGETEFQRKVAREPENLFIWLPQIAKVELKVRSVIFQRDKYGEMRTRSGYEEWRTVEVPSMPEGSRLLTIPFKDLPKGPFQMKIEAQMSNEKKTQELVVDFN